MRVLLVIISLTILASCQREIKVKFEVMNLSDQTIDSICVKSSNQDEQFNFIHLEPGEQKTYWLDMTGLPKQDGNYALTFKRNQPVKETKHFGYFTNGYPLEQLTVIRIEKDTVILDPSLEGY
jgi:hypothetical protein